MPGTLKQSKQYDNNSQPLRARAAKSSRVRTSRQHPYRSERAKSRSDLPETRLRAARGFRQGGAGNGSSGHGTSQEAPRRQTSCRGHGALPAREASPRQETSADAKADMVGAQSSACMGTTTEIRRDRPPGESIRIIGTLENHPDRLNAVATVSGSRPAKGKRKSRNMGSFIPPSKSPRPPSAVGSRATQSSDSGNDESLDKNQNKIGIAVIDETDFDEKASIQKICHSSKHPSDENITSRLGDDSGHVVQAPQPQTLPATQTCQTSSEKRPPVRRKLDFSGLPSNRTLTQSADNKQEAIIGQDSPMMSIGRLLDKGNMETNQEFHEISHVSAIKKSADMLTGELHAERNQMESRKPIVCLTNNFEGCAEVPVKNKPNKVLLGNGTDKGNMNLALPGDQRAFRITRTATRKLKREQDSTKSLNIPGSPYTQLTGNQRIRLGLSPDNQYASSSLEDISFWQKLRLDSCELVNALRNQQSYTDLLKTNGMNIESLTLCSLLQTTDVDVKQFLGLVPQFCCNIKELIVDLPELPEKVVGKIVLTNKLQKLKVRKMFVTSFKSLLSCLMPLADLKELEIHLGDEIEVDMDRENIWDVIVTLGQFLRRNRCLKTVKFFFTVNTEMVRSILNNCHDLTHLELHVVDAHIHLRPRAFEVCHPKLNTLVVRSKVRFMTHLWLRTFMASFPSLQIMELTGLRR